MHGQKNIKLFLYKLNFAQDSYFMYVYISILQSALNRLFTEAVIIQFVLLKMSKVLLETC